MEKTKVIEVIADVLKEIQSMSGRTPVPISATTCPIGDLADFDSLNGVEATIELSDRLGIEIPGVNGFVNEQGTKALTISEIADRICSVAVGVESKP
jgi:acyl carrier protein